MPKVIKRTDGSVRVCTENNDESRVAQNHGNECNINSIMEKARRGIPPRIQENRGCYGDFSDAVDYHQAMTRVADAKSDFASLPSAVRAKFDNDPENLIEFISNPENLKEAQKLGLLPADLTYVEAVKESEDKKDEEPPETPQEPPADPPADAPE